MKHRVLVALLAVLAPMLASAADLDIPAQPLGAALEALSRQGEVRIVFEPGLVALHDAPALKGTFTPERALDTLLARTDLTYHVKDTKTLEIAMAVDDEVTVRGRYDKLSAVRREMVRLEDQFYAEYNELNTDRQWDVHCSMQAPTGTRFESRVCMPVFVDTITRNFYSHGILGDASGDPWIQIQAKRGAFRQNMIDQINRNPKLLELLMKRNAAARRYAELRRQKFAGGRVFVWE